MEPDATLVARLRAAGCVFAEEEAGVLAAAAGSAADLAAMAARRVAGEPLEQVVGWASFDGLRILVDPGVFAPRRRSEFLVAVAAGLARRAPARPAPGGPAGAGPRPVIVDLCCGTGALGLAVALRLASPPGRAADAARRPGSTAADPTAPGTTAAGTTAAGTTAAGTATAGTATAGPTAAGTATAGPELHAADLDPAAVACARRNIAPAGGLAYQGDLFGALPAALRGRVTVLICNAPYVPSGRLALLPAEARDHEPRLALDGGPDGLAVLRRAAAAAPRWLAPGGTLLVETSTRQARAMAAAVSAAGLRARVHGDADRGATVVTGQRARAR